MRFIASILLLVFLASCGGANQQLVNRNKLQYKSSKSAAPLSYPPDLSSDKIADSYALPNNLPQVSTLSQYNNTQLNIPNVPMRETVSASPNVLPVYANMRLMRSGNMRWIQTSMRPAVLWPKIRNFWQKNGLEIAKENSLAGTMETKWAENRAELSRGPIRRLLRRVMDAAYSTGSRDKFRLRIERAPANKTDIYISHQRMIEKLAGGENAVWTHDKSIPEYESEMLALLMAHLGASQQAVEAAKVSHRVQQTQRSATIPQTSRAPSNVTTFERAKLVMDNSGVTSLQVMDKFANAWRLVGNALDRTGFAVEDTNRTARVYYINYQDPMVTSQKEGLLSKVLKRKVIKQEKYTVMLHPVTPNVSKITVANRANQLLNAETSKRILTILYEQLR